MGHFIDILLGEYTRRAAGLVGLLRQVRVFSPFEDSQLRAFLDKIEPVELKKGEVVYR